MPLPRSFQIAFLTVLAGFPVGNSAAAHQETSVRLRDTSCHLVRTVQADQLADAYIQFGETTCPRPFLVGEHIRPSHNQDAGDRLRSLWIETDVKIDKDGEDDCWSRIDRLDNLVADIDSFKSKDRR